MKSVLPLLLVRIQTDPGQLFLSYLWEFLQVLPSTTTSILPPQLQRSLSCEYRSPATPAPNLPCFSTAGEHSSSSPRDPTEAPLLGKMEVVLIPPWRTVGLTTEQHFSPKKSTHVLFLFHSNPYSEPQCGRRAQALWNSSAQCHVYILHLGDWMHFCI